MVFLKQDGRIIKMVRLTTVLVAYYNGHNRYIYSKILKRYDRKQKNITSQRKDFMG